MLALVGIMLPCSHSSMDSLSSFSVVISVVIIFMIFVSTATTALSREPQDESALKKHHGKRLKVEASLYKNIPGDNRCATLFSYPGAYGIELIYCYTSCKFEAGDIVDVTYQEQSKALHFNGSGVARTSHL